MWARLTAALLTSCSWGVHSVAPPTCAEGEVVCGLACIPAEKVCQLGISVMRSRLQGQGPAVDVLVVKTVATESPAEAAGLRPGDAITAIDGNAPTEENLEAALASEEQKPILIQFLRQGFLQKTRVVINQRRRPR